MLGPGEVELLLQIVSDFHIRIETNVLDGFLTNRVASMGEALCGVGSLCVHMGCGLVG